MIDIEKDYFDIASDLGLDRPFIKGERVPVKNCWHFYTSGDSIEVMFRNDEDFRNGMNRIYTVSCAYDILILAFVLMVHIFISFCMESWRLATASFMNMSAELLCIFLRITMSGNA